MKLWAGRFQKQTDELVNDFNASISFDQRLYEQDITGSMAHAQMLCDCGILTAQDNEKIQQGLTELLAEIEAGKVTFTADNEDIHMNVETLLTAKIGDAGKRLHTARSRNDQVALDFRLYLREEISSVIEKLLQMEKVLCEKAKAHTQTVMPGYTHLQRAQPITFAQHLLAYASMFTRDITRLEDCRTRMNECPLGSGALAGTTYPIDRFQTASALGFAGPMKNSLDGVSDRDYALEFLSDASILMMHLSRFSEEIIAWCSWEFKFVELDDAYATGSSIMPQKKNPDVPETARGKCARVVGDLISMAMLMKGLPLAYNKDLQEDKEPVFDAIDTVKDTLRAFIEMMAGVVPNREQMRKAAAAGYPTATDLADYLTRRGVPFRTAHDIVGRVVRHASAAGCDIAELSLDDLRSYSDVITDDVYKVLTLEGSVAARNHVGGTAPNQVLKQVERWEAIFKDRHAKGEA